MSDPRFEGMSTDEVAQMLVMASWSKDPSDIQFAKDCASEIKKRKPGASRGRGADSVPEQNVPGAGS